ncbi:NAD(P)H-hydrate dehydratase, partial [Oxalobacteraceae bacterium OM1]
MSDMHIIDDDSLRAWPLPMPDDEGDKEERGRVLVIAGSPEMPGAALLAGTAALRAGAGKLTFAAPASVAPLIGVARPEARVIPLPETAAGGFALHGVEKVLPLLQRCNAVLVGPGMQDEPAICAFVLALLPHLKEVPLVLDAGGMNVVRRQLQAVDAGAHEQRYVNSFSSPVLLTPHAGEMAHLSGMDKDAVQDDPPEAARTAARRWNALI